MKQPAPITTPCSPFAAACRRFRRAARALASRPLALLLFASAFACGAADGPEPGAELAQTEQALNNGGGRVGGTQGYSCKNGTCTCDKEIENDCEDMSGVCVDEDIDGLINCINGWFTNGCSCRELRTRTVRPGRDLAQVIQNSGVLAAP